MNTTVTNLVMLDTAGVKTVDQIVFERSGESGQIAVRPVDRVFVTLGSMTEGSSLGSMDEAPLAKGKAAGGAWTLWETIAAGRAEFGSPGVFSNHADQSKWVSFTTTMRDPTLLRIVRDLTGNVPGEGGLITFPQSNWLASIVKPSLPRSALTSAPSTPTSKRRRASSRAAGVLRLPP